MERLSSFPRNHEIIEIEHDDMKPPGSYRGIRPSKSEIRTEERDESSLASHVSRISSLEDDLNQLFEIFNRRASSRMGVRHHQNGAGSSKKNASKRPIGSHGSSSPNGSGFSDKVNLKQALRGLCISQASEMAATRRSSKLGGSSGVGRITTMYRNVVVEDDSLTTSQDGLAKSSLPEISLISKQQSVNSLQRSPESPVVVPHFPSSNYTAALDEGVRSNSEIQKQRRALNPSEARVAEVKLADISIENSPSLSSFTPNRSPDRIVKSGQCSSVQDIRTFTPNEPNCRSSVTQISPKERPLSSMPSSPQAIHDSLQTRDRNCQIESEFCVSDESPSPTSLAKFYLKAHHAPLPSTSYSTEESSTLEKGTTITSRTEIIQPSSSSGSKEKSLKMDKLHKEVQPTPQSPLPLSRSDLSGNDSWETSKSATAPYLPVNTETMVKPARLGNKGSDVKEGKKGYLKKSDKSTKGISNTKRKAGKGVSRLVKPVIKTRNYVKRKSKKDPKNPPYSSINNTHSEFNNILYPGSDHVVCPKCHCVVSEAWEETEGDDGDSQLSPFASPINDFSPASFMGSPINGFSSASPIGSPINGFSPASCTVVPSAEIFPISPIVSPKAETSSDFVFSDSGRPSYKLGIISKPQEVVEPEVRKNPKSRRDKGEFTQSSKSSPDECSTSTSNSGESHLSRPSFCDRPHMSKDVRWQAIRQVRIEHGSLGLRNFNLLKKLGCGDIGTVYLAELIGTNCLFAIKVMDNDFLARRKKIARAQAEREILRMLDHPFLPTLYCQFTSDNLSCLVMEYCPGGDLHVLRQRQPGRCFTEQAARFYVAEVLLALEYLHMLGVVYRDLKPENILVREDGHIMLSDFDLSLRCAVNPTLLVASSTGESADTSNVKAASSAASCAEPFCIQKPSCRVTCFGPRVHSRSNPRKLKAEPVDPFRLLPLLIAEPTAARSNSFVGTHEYLAPEIIKGEGHGSAVDWWTFGIFLYELLYGRTPFRGASNEETLANVVLESLRFPDFPLVSLQARDLIVSLLVKEPEGRLGTERGAAEIKQHPFFEGLNWALIRCAVPPELPEARSYGAGHANELSYDQVGSHSNNYIEYDDSTGDHVEFEVF